MTDEEKEELKTTVQQIIERYLADPDHFELDLRELDLRFKLKGDKWGGIVDRPIAKFLLDLDKRLHEEMARLGAPLPKSTHGVVALRIEEGSFEAFLEHAKGYMTTFGKMNARSQVLLLLAIMGVFGIWMSPEIIEKIQAPAEAENASKERIALVEAVASMAENQREIQSPIRALVQSMDADDKVILPGSKEEITKKEMKREVLVKGTRSEPRNYVVDFKYVVQDIAHRKPGEWEVGLAFGETKFRAQMEVTEEQIADILKAFQEAHANGTEITPDLQVTAKINDKGIRSALVVGVGEKRPGTVTLGEAFAKEAERAFGVADEDEEPPADDEE